MFIYQYFDDLYIMVYSHFRKYKIAPMNIMNIYHEHDMMAIST